MKVKIKKISDNAVVPFKTYEDDFCYDVVATSCEEVKPNIFKYGIGLAFEIDRENSQENTENYNLSIDIRPRSSIWKTGFILCNCEATVDEPYRGEVFLMFYKVGEGEIYKIGDKIGQLKIGFTTPIDFEEVSELGITKRGDKGFGHTGK
jgi:dUTP pyrophosphatase